MPEYIGKLYSIRCPVHPNQEIGVARFENCHRFDQGHFCPVCKKHRFFDEKQFDKFINLGYFPEKIIQN